jgi:hypothetical protein
MSRVKEVSKESGMSVDAIVALLTMMEAKKEREDEDNILPDDFNPFYDSKFMISFADSPDLGKKLLVEMDLDDLKRLRAEIDATLKVQEGE